MLFIPFTLVLLALALAMIYTGTQAALAVLEKQRDERLRREKRARRFLAEALASRLPTHPDAGAAPGGRKKERARPRSGRFSGPPPPPARTPPAPRAS